MENVQHNIFKTVDILVNRRVESLQLDKTITATIVSCTNALTREYKAKYQGGFITVYAQEGATYSDNTSVYVLVPENDFSKVKYILSKAQAVTEDKNISFLSSNLSNYNLIGANAITPLKRQGICSYYQQDGIVLYDKTRENEENSPNLVQIDHSSLLRNLQEADAVLIEASFESTLPMRHILTTTGSYGVEFVLAFKDKSVWTEENPAIKKYSYIIDSNKMVGNPFVNGGWQDQNDILPIDVKNFLYVDSIVFYCKDFIEKDDVQAAKSQGKDLFIKDIEIYGLRTITAKDGDYLLSISTPQGNTFISENATEKLNVVATFKNKNINISNQAMYYWFREDAKVSISSPDYHMYGRAGWRYLKDKKNDYTLTLNAAENKAAAIKYKCVAVYQQSLTLVSEFTMYNRSASRTIEITSSLGTEFSFDAGQPVLTCNIDGHAEDFDRSVIKDENDETTKLRRPDDWYTFTWAKEDQDGKTTIFNRTIADINNEIDAIRKDMNETQKSSKILALQNEKYALEDVKFEIDKNVLEYPVKNIENTATFKCSVYTKDTQQGEPYYIGTASLSLQNSSSATPNDYNIIIENGDQVFQYSETGVSPTNERYNEPLEIRDLRCHFFNPTGLEVDPSQYSVKWLFPLEDTLIETPEEKMMRLNPATEKKEWFDSQICTIKIKDDYDYSAQNNQITCIVKFDGVEYTKDTRFLFTKIGDNGTNGTDIVAKISPKDIENTVLNKEMLALELYTLNKGEDPDGQPITEEHIVWNTGQNNKEEVLKFQLFNRNNLVQEKIEPLWRISGSSTKYLSVTTSGVITYNSAQTGNSQNQIVRGECTYNNNKYYAFYPIVVVDYRNTTSPSIKVSVDNKQTLKSILYNADGRNPLYNKKQNVKINIERRSELAAQNDDALGDSVIAETPSTQAELEELNKFMVWSVQGGVDGKGDFYIAKSPDNKEGLSLSSPIIGEMLDQVYIIPKEQYSGEYTDNLVKCEIYNKYSDYWDEVNQSPVLGRKPETTVYIPIYMSLNTYGLASLNAWDGNHVEINEDKNYIMAPQIGAGTKNNDNTFTGIVMGQVGYYDETKKSQTGLFGYSKGRQSIFLDAETGRAVFGLRQSESSSTVDNKSYNSYKQGRIELNPDGDSKIGAWTIGSTALFNIDGGDSISPIQPTIESYVDFVKDANGEIIKNPYKITIKEGLDFDVIPVEFIDDKGKVIDKERFVAEEDETPIQYELDKITIRRKTDHAILKSTTLTRENSLNKSSEKGIILNSTYDGAPSNTRQVIPHNKEGILLNASPAVISIKTPPLSADDGIKFNEANTILKEGDSLELELNPSNPSVFSIYRHAAENAYEEPATPGKPKKFLNTKGYTKRHQLVGINANGQFFTNAVENGDSSMGIGPIGAFGQTAAGEEGKIGYTGVQFAYNNKNLLKIFTDNDDDGFHPLYLSTGTTTDNEYARPLKLYGNSINLYASHISKDPQTNYRLNISPNDIFLGSSVSSLTLEPIQIDEIVKDDQGNSVKNEDGTDKIQKVDGSAKLEANTHILFRTAHNKFLTLDSGGESTLVLRGFSNDENKDLNSRSYELTLQRDKYETIGGSSFSNITETFSTKTTGMEFFSDSAKLIIGTLETDITRREAERDSNQKLIYKDKDDNIVDENTPGAKLSIPEITKKDRTACLILNSGPLGTGKLQTEGNLDIRSGNAVNITSQGSQFIKLTAIPLGRVEEESYNTTLTLFGENDSETTSGHGLSITFPGGSLSASNQQWDIRGPDGTTATIPHGRWLFDGVPIFANQGLCITNTISKRRGNFKLSTPDGPLEVGLFNETQSWFNGWARFETGVYTKSVKMFNNVSYDRMWNAYGTDITGAGGSNDVKDNLQHIYNILKSLSNSVYDRDNDIKNLANSKGQWAWNYAHTKLSIEDFNVFKKTLRDANSLIPGKPSITSATAASNAADIGHIIDALKKITNIW